MICPDMPFAGSCLWSGAALGRNSSVSPTWSRVLSKCIQAPFSVSLSHIILMADTKSVYFYFFGFVADVSAVK